MRRRRRGEGGSGGGGDDGALRDVAAYCEAACACDAGAPDASSCASTCEGELAELRDDAAGCSDDFAAYALCLKRGAGCDGATPREPSCDAAYDAFAGCAAVPEDETAATGADPDESGAGGFGGGGGGAGGEGGASGLGGA